MHEICHWVAPPVVPVRFDARYFAIAVDGDIEPVVDDREIVDAWWTTPRELLAGWDEGEHKLYWPTWFTVNEIAACRSVDALFALSIVTREPDDEELERLPRSTFWQD